MKIKVYLCIRKKRKPNSIMKVCVAEKPSVAKEIADIVGAKSRHDGY